MSKELEALERIGNNNVIYYRNGLECSYDIKDTDEYEIIEKTIEALEIIKDEFNIHFNDNKQEITIVSVSYPYSHITFSLTRKIEDKNRYDLLKEVLNGKSIDFNN